METDRAAVLTARAAARGVIDFSRARLLDPQWWRRAGVLIRAMAADDELTALRAAFDLQRSLAANAGLTPESFAEVQKAARELCHDLLAAARPWAAKSAAAFRKQHAADLADLYRRKVGDPKDPAFRAKLAADRAALEARRAAPPRETDEDRVDRLLRQRGRRRRP